ncbi:hypothetical protein K503DRAFT_787412 [Rhizopogon vinicolor AM-OR11-026]|uniref:Uncharacterized protein n=1 Tax=Rhizopogon vinicolor AM-OR11-026 TaxID=1314800 RepID=A0A1B7MHM6_9AGAM|nr:hypothetical protein K503DRAFT_787412 [Rhizopogon vinicolor AM-OR11-026]
MVPPSSPSQAILHNYPLQHWPSSTTILYSIVTLPASTLQSPLWSPFRILLLGICAFFLSRAPNSVLLFLIVTSSSHIQTWPSRSDSPEAMTQRFDGYLFPPEQNAPPPPPSSDVGVAGLPPTHLPSNNYIQEQYGGGRRHESPPVELTPTRLRSTIKATHRDSGIVREAVIRRQGNLLPPDTHANASASPETAPSNTSVTGGGESSSSLPSGNGCRMSPYLGGPPSPHPAALQDMFYNPMDAQATWLTQDSSTFGMMEDDSFAAMLMDHSQDHFLTTPSYSNQQNIIEGSSSQHVNQEAVLASLTTNIIPPTPLKDAGSNSSIARGGQDYEDTPASTSGEPFITGRKSADTQAILEAGFIDIEQSFLQLSESTSMPIQQIINSFLKSHGRTTVNTNFWNIYACSYFKDNVEEELARVGAVLPADGGSPNTSIRTKCYELFKGAFPDTYKNILTVYDEMKMLSGSPHTVSQHAQELQKYYKRLFSTIDSAAAKFGFETAVIICGKIVNQDASLGQVHMSPGAADFFSFQCHADDDTIIGHLKAHVYNKTSLTTVEEAFNDESPEHKKEEDTFPKAQDVSTEPTEGRDEGIQWFKKEFPLRVAQQGGSIPPGDFPWKQMIGILADAGLFIKGYPAHKCLMPGEYSSVSAKNKGIAGLPREGITALVDALKAGTMRVVKSSSKLRASLIASELPVIIGEAPPSTWDHSCAHCMFANGQTDYGGPPRLKPSSALTRVRKAESLLDRHATAKGVLPPPPPTRSVKVGPKPAVPSAIIVPPSPPPFDPSKVIYKPLKKAVPSVVVSPSHPNHPPVCPSKVVSKAPPKPPQEEVLEIKSTSDSQEITVEDLDAEYEDDTLGKSSRASKKRALSDEGVEPKKTRNNKGKKPLKPSDASPSKGGPESPLTVKSSGDEEHPGGQAEMLPAIRLHDGPPEWETRTKALPKPKPVTKGSRGRMNRAHRMVYSDSEAEDAPGEKNGQAKAPPAAPLEAQPDTLAPVAAVVAMEVTVEEVPQQDDVLTPLEVPLPEPHASNNISQTASGEESSEPLPQSSMPPPSPSPEARRTEHYRHQEHYPPIHAHEPPVHPCKPVIHPREPVIHPSTCTSA